MATMTISAVDQPRESRLTEKQKKKAASWAVEGGALS
jgi:hypothetical protein